LAQASSSFVVGPQPLPRAMAALLRGAPRLLFGSPGRAALARCLASGPLPPVVADLKLTYYTASFVPNPRVVETCAREKGIDLTLVEKQVDLLGGENRKGEALAKNPMGQLPFFELEDGTVIADTIAMVEYLEEKVPSPALIGSTPEQRAATRMWQRRMEEHFVYPAFTAFRFWTASADCGEESGFKNFFATRAPVLIPSAYKDMQLWALKHLRWLEAQKAKSPSEFICGPSVTVVDFQVFITLDFFKDKSLPFLEEHGSELPWLKAWFSRMEQRQSHKDCMAHINSL